MSVEYFTTGHYCIEKKSNCVCCTWDGTCTAVSCPRIKDGYELVHNWLRKKGEYKTEECCVIGEAMVD